MTPEQKIKHLILLKAIEWDETLRDSMPEIIVSSNIDDVYEEAEDVYDASQEIREGEVETNIGCEGSRHYESKSVAAKMPDGTWVGWTYWYGGGKHGNPEEIDWMDDAYDLNCVEKQELVTVQTFSKIEVSA